MTWRESPDTLPFLLSLFLQCCSVRRASTASDMRSVIRDRIRTHLADIEIILDTKELQDEIHDIVNAQVNREKDRLEWEGSHLRGEGGTDTLVDRDGLGTVWGSSLFFAIP